MPLVDPSADLAEAILAFRRIRPEELPSGLFSETGWEILLELFIADAKGQRLTGRMIAKHGHTPRTTASRWLEHLSAEGLVVGDGDGNLDHELSLSARGLKSMEDLLERGRELQIRLATTSSVERH